MINNHPEIIKGGIHQDNRGIIKFVNDFYFDHHNIKRFYFIKNTNINLIRAWQAHKNESKYFFVTSGEFVIQVVKIDNWNKPSNNLEVKRYLLSENDSSILYIPPGFANGFKAEKPNSTILIFSDKTLEDSISDDFRFDKYMWSDWSE